MNESTQGDIEQPLPGLSFDVVKINKYNTKQFRTLRLTSVGVENIRKNGKVSSVHTYKQIIKITLRTLDTFVISYEDQKHDYVYKSQVAMHIVNEMTSRLDLNKQRHRNTLNVDMARQHQEKLQKTGELTRMIAATKAKTTESFASLSRGNLKQAKAKKLQSLLGVTEQHRIATAVDLITLDESTPEGKTLKQFCNNFVTLEKNQTTLVMNVRQFIDQLRSYIMERHEKDLGKLLVEATSQSFTPTELSLSSTIEHSLEKAIIPRFKDRIIPCLNLPPKEIEKKLSDNIQQVKSKCQQYFDVPDEYVSESNWGAAVLELQNVNQTDLPQEQLSSILNAAKTIYSLFNVERSQREDAKESKEAHFISADNFLPVFIYVVVQADVFRPLILCEYLWNLCDPEQLNGEGGYYLTVFGSALEYLKGIDIVELDKLHEEKKLSPRTSGPDNTKRDVIERQEDVVSTPSESVNNWEKVTPSETVKVEEEIQAQFQGQRRSELFHSRPRLERSTSWKSAHMAQKKRNSVLEIGSLSRHSVFVGDYDRGRSTISEALIEMARNDVGEPAQVTKENGEEEKKQDEDENKIQNEDFNHKDTTTETKEKEEEEAKIEDENVQD